ncbi:sterol uptake control protein 2 [Parachaetomium inaequale]|uniref:Sterol uptake control protein 2 n=1 Tax=Parachaetomium inaequale TaxID=2588326 RepID=A0AAN6PIH9_9PEZI|nr:sterol uptake control protein 2 [Parachaetomium inaequale]
MDSKPVTEAKFLVMAAKGPNPKVKEYKRRRHHSKNRLGCLSCRQKRVKCDQGKPICARCGRSGAPCRYETACSVLVPSSSSSALLSKPLPEWSTTLAESILQPRLLRTAGRNTARQLPIQALLGHATQGDVFGLPLTPTLWELACQHPHLLASILAVSACRLRMTVPDGHPHRVAECALEAVALGDFQPALAAPLTQSRSDALLLTSMLLNNLAFFVSGSDEGRGYPSVSSSPWCTNNPHNNSSGATGLEWLALSMGLRPLLAATQAFHGADSALAPIFAASDDENKTFSRSHEDLGGAPAHWVRLVCSSGSSTTLGSKERCLREPLGTLAATRTLPPVVENGLKYVQLVGKLEPAFMEMLCDRDERAMWMLGYWLGLMGQLGPWWSSGRVRRDGAAIRTFLLEAKGVCGRGGEEGEMWRLLMRDYDFVYSTVLL